MPGLMSNEELGEVGRWSDKAKKAKGGFVTHTVGDITGIKKECGHFMGSKCNCCNDRKGKND